MQLAADTDIWRWQPHPEVWFIVVAAIGLAWYAVRVIGPKVVTRGEPIVSRQQIIAYTLAITTLWIASDWPMHDISEEYLYSVHMIQHLLLTFIIPPLLLIATPEWLGRLMVSGDGRAGVWIRRWSRPVVAGVLFNAFVALTHLAWVVNTSVNNGIFHYAVHLAVFGAALLMWIPVASPLPELRASLPGQMIFLFLMSVLPTIPAAFLTFARQPLYEAYNHNVRLWGIDVASDQQAAGLVMKLAGGIFLWTIITLLFVRWTRQEEGTARQMRRVAAKVTSDDDDLTFADVQEAFDLSTPPARID